MVIDYKIILVAIIFICADIVTGLVSSFVTSSFDSSVMREGGKHKLVLTTAIGFGVLLDISQQMVDLGFSIPATAGICSYIALMEILSCVENINKAFPEALPKTITNILQNTAKGVIDHEDNSSDNE